MSIKDLFNNTGTPKIQKTVTSDELVEQVESEEYVEAKRKEFEQFIPPIDFVSASNFAKFGSAELYYEKSFERIYQYYPYDGTLAEKVEFHNSSSYLDKYVFDYLYPRTNGYINFDRSQPQYITVFGGPHTASSGMIGEALDSTFDNSVVYNASKDRTSAFEFRGEDGITIEFWMKVPSLPGGTHTLMQVTGSGDDTIQLRLNSSDEFQLRIVSGALPAFSTTVLENVIAGENNTWNHYSITLQSSSAGLRFKGFKNGQEQKSVLETGASYNVPQILPTTEGLNLSLGAKYDGTEPISASIDEFRYWKTARTPEAIFNTWFIPVGGGTNKYDANVKLGLYFKFNEGITGNDDLDSIALDYSGRINNGTIVNYDSTMRNTASAITEKLSEPEYLEPIIYSSHPDVAAKKAEYKTSGSLADLENPSMLYRYFPAWMQEEDEQNGKQLKYLAQVMGSYFDTLWHQIGFLDRIHDNHYISGSNKPLPFAKKLLYDKGFVIPDLFVDATIVESLRSKDDNEVYEKQISEVRNTIYHNIYNNLDGIYKSKGTEKSFRNFFRSLGIGQDVVKLRMYADDSTFVLRNNYEYKSYERKYLNFNYEGHFDATLYQTSSANNANIYIPGDRNYSGSFTMETEIILPRKNRGNGIGFLPYSDLTASVMGFHSTGSEYTHPLSDYGLSVYVIKENTDSDLDPQDSHTVRFMVAGGFGELTSSTYGIQYENNKWNLAVRVRHENYPYGVNGNYILSSSNEYVLEFYGVEADGNTKVNSFLVTSSIRAEYFTDDKIFYAGAHRTNFTGSSLYNTDIKLGLVRYWHSYLTDAAIDQHAYDSETFGANEPFENDLVNTYPIEIPREKTLALHWAFNDLTSSDSSGELLVSDLSSGSSDSNYGPLSDTIQRYVQGRAVGFNASAQNALDKTYVQTARKRLPDDLMSSDLTTIKTEETEQFFVDDDVSDNFYSFEKSMWGTISDEMMSMFSTALDLNNLVGQPNQKYHHRYNMADFLRDRFFDDVENEPDIEKFTSFYKWIDDSISIALQQLTPASSRFSENIKNVVESHVLERSKYVHQIPIVAEFRSTEGSIKGISELKYDWKNGHAPFFPDEEQKNVLWQRERRQKPTGSLRETLRVSRNNHSIQSSGLTRREIDGSTSISDVYAVRKFSKTYDFQVVSQPSIHGGINFSRQKNIQLFKESIFPAGAVGSSGNPQNIITVGVGDGTGLIRGVRNDDNPPRKKQYNTQALVGRLEGNEYGHEIQGDIILPFNIMSGTVHSGYNKIVRDLYEFDAIFTNLHKDVIGRQNEISIQGPFTEAHIGGLQYHHIDVNRYDASKTVDVVRQTGGTFPSGSIQFTASVLATKLTAGTGSSVTIRDGDGTTITALYSNVFDLYDNQWTNMDDLVFIIDNKLNVTANKISDNFLALTQSVTGGFYNYQIQSSSHGYITASGFDGGTAITSSTFTRNLDGPSNRPEGWGLVFKDHPSQGDNDGSFGIIGVDYGTPYPYTEFRPATRYREEYAKRPVNIKNIKTLTGSLKAGNYTNEVQIFSVAPEHQKTWAIEAYDDPNINILPTFITGGLPDSTHYQTLIGIAPYLSGNVFGVANNNRQPDTGSVSVGAISSYSYTTGSFTAEANNGVDRSTHEIKISRDAVTTDFEIGGSTAGNTVGVDYSGRTDSSNFDALKDAINARYPSEVTATYNIDQVSRYYLGLEVSTSPITSVSNSSRLTGSYSSGFGVATGDLVSVGAWMYFEGAPATLNEENYLCNLDGRTEVFFSGSDIVCRLTYTDGRGDVYQDTAKTDVSPYYGKSTHFIAKTTGVSTLNTSQAIKFMIDGSTVTSAAVTETLAKLIVDNSGIGGAPSGSLQYRTDGSNISLFQNLARTREVWVDELVIYSDNIVGSVVTNLISGPAGPVSTIRLVTHLQLASQIYGASSGSISDSGLANGVVFPNNPAGASTDFELVVASGFTAKTMYNPGDRAGWLAVSGSATYTLTVANTTTDRNVFLARTGTTFDNAINTTSTLISTPILAFSNDNVIEVPSTASQYTSERNINTRFSAPGGPEVQSIGYLDAYTSTYSVHNVLPFRNLSVLGSGSGESTTIRVEDHLGKRRGLKTLRTLHMGQFGADGQFGVIESDGYVFQGSFNKQHRNRSRAYEYSSGVLIITGSNYDNMHINSPIPRSEFQYSWIRAAVSGSGWEDNQRILGYGPVDGIVSASVGYVEAIVFPSASSIYSA